jgi:hypothetical protein
MGGARRGWVVRIDDRYVVGFRVPKDPDAPIAENERRWSPHCLLVLGDGPPYQWHPANRYQPAVIAERFGGQVQPSLAPYPT